MVVSSRGADSGIESVLITGASYGIGTELAREFARNGHDLILAARSADKLEQLAEELSDDHGVLVSVRPADLSRPEAAEKLHNSLRREGFDVDILVNNAGVLEHGRFADMTPTDHRRMVELNVAGLTDMVAQFLPDMLERGAGRIMNVASIGAFMPVPTLATYAATKAYVLSLSEALEVELRDSGVTVTALCPGFTRTPMVENAQDHSAGFRLPDMVVGDAAFVAREGYRGCMRGTTIVVPGRVNLASTLATRAAPKWLVRRLGDALGRLTMDKD
jgi:short-subunit dehydrogenase